MKTVDRGTRPARAATRVPARVTAPVLVAASARRMLTGCLSVCVAGCAAVTLTGCANTVEKGRQQVHTQVQTTHEEAVRSALDAVRGGRLVKLELGEDWQHKPEWQSEVVAEDGERQEVDQSAMDAELPTAKPAVHPAGPSTPRLRALLDEVVVKPEGAVRKVAKPDYDKVDSVELTRSDGKPVWRIKLIAVEPGNAHVYEIDAVTGDVLDRHHA